MTANVTTFRSTIPEPTVCATPVPKKNAAAKLKNAAQMHRLARRQDARRDDGRDRVRGVVEAVDVVEDQRNGNQREDGSSSVVVHAW